VGLRQKGGEEEQEDCCALSIVVRGYTSVRQCGSTITEGELEGELEGGWFASFANRSSLDIWVSTGFLVSVVWMPRMKGRLTVS